jgi:siroheme synthase-like protein
MKTTSYPRFPLFIDLHNKAVLIAGGGKVAARRAKVLLEFGAVVTVVSPEICTDMSEIRNQITWKKQCYDGIDQGFSLVIAATDDRGVNKSIGERAGALGIPVSVADRKEESTFWFPAVARGGGIIAGLISEEGNHSAVKEAAINIRKMLGKRE